MKPRTGTLELLTKDALSYVGNNLTWNTSSRPITITRLSCLYLLKGGQIALLYTVNGGILKHFGTLRINILRLEFFLPGDDVDKNGPAIKSKKERLIDVIHENNQALFHSFWKKVKSLNQLLNLKQEQDFR